MSFKVGDRVELIKVHPLVSKYLSVGDIGVVRKSCECSLGATDVEWDTAYICIPNFALRLVPGDDEIRECYEQLMKEKEHVG